MSMLWTGLLVVRPYPATGLLSCENAGKLYDHYERLPMRHGQDQRLDRKVHMTLWIFSGFLLSALCGHTFFPNSIVY